MPTVTTPTAAAELKKSRSIAVVIEVFFATALFLIALFVFSFLAHEAVSEHEALFDNRVFAFFHSHVSPSMLPAIRIFTYGGSHYFLFPAYVIFIIGYLLNGKRTDAIDVAVVGITSTAMMFILKYFFHRQRPDMPLFKAVSGYSFPSGHALSTFIFCSLLIHLVWHTHWRTLSKWLLSILLVLFSIAIGISRIILRVHYPTDVVAGFCFGYSWVMLLLFVQHQVRKYPILHFSKKPHR